MVAFLASLLGHVRGGLQYVLVAAMYLVSGISGSKAADMAAVAPVLFPEMKARGAKPGDLVALLAATGAQTETIPPSLVLITIGSVTGVSIAALFTGGLLPGVVLAVLLCCVVRWRYRQRGPSEATRASKGEIGARLSGRAAGAGAAVPDPRRGGRRHRHRHRSLDHRHRLFGHRRAADLSPVRLARAAADAGVDRGSVRRDPADHRHRDRHGLGTDPVRLLAHLGRGDDRNAGRRGDLHGGIDRAFVVLGSVLEGIPAIVLFGPLLFPIARAVGIHEVHYAMVVILAMGIGLFAPPFGVGYYAACAIGRVEPADGMRPIWGYMLALILGTIVVAAVPWISIGFLR